jgi:hypothetical protein
MQSDDATERIEWDVQELRRSIDEWDHIASQIIELLQATVDGARSQNWRAHYAQIVGSSAVSGALRIRIEAARLLEGRWTLTR